MPDAPDFERYAEDAQTYLNRPQFKGTPLTGNALAQRAWETWANTGIYVPPELALAQLQRETMMGLRGRNPRTNPANVGEFDSGTTQRFPDTSTGLGAYYNLIANKYLRGKKMSDLTRNFVNTEGNRYASDRGYEGYLQTQIPYIQRYITRGRQNAIRNTR